MSATVRKNFVFKEEVAAHLEELARNGKKSMTALVEELVEHRYRNEREKKRLEAFKESIEIADEIGSGLLEGKSIQSIKADRNV